MHMSSGLEDPTKHVFFKQVLQSLKRGLCVNKAEKSVVFVNGLKIMVTNTNPKNLREIRILTMILLAF